MKKFHKRTSSKRNILISLIILVSLLAGILLFSIYRNSALFITPTESSPSKEQEKAYSPKIYTPEALQGILEQKDKYVILDVRDKREYDRGHIPGAVHADYHDAEALKKAVGNKTPITYCTYSAWRGPYAAYQLHKSGIPNVGVVVGGVTSWDEKIGLLTSEDNDTPFIYPHPEPDVLFPERALLSPMQSKDTVEIDMTAKQFSFSPSTVVVQQGQKVILNITANDIAHGFALPEFGIAEELLPRQTKRIEFVADRKGVFPFVCSVYCGQVDDAHSHYSMTGEIIVQ